MNMFTKWLMVIRNIFSKLFSVIMSNFVMVVFSLLFLYFVVAVSSCSSLTDDYKCVIWSMQGAVCSGGVILLWLCRWKRLDKNYRQIAVFFWLVFGYFLFLNLCTLFKIFL